LKTALALRPTALIVLTLALLVLTLDSCAPYADFNLPVLPQPAAMRFEWMPREEPVLRPGAPGDWDSHDALNPSVVHRENLYFNLYSGFDGKTWHTGLATSEDGLAWRKQGRVLSPDPTTWEGDYIAANGSAMFAQGEFFYWYQTGVRDRPSIALARSADARTWSKERAAVIASVVPTATASYMEAARKLCGTDPLEVSSRIPSGVDIQYRDPQSTGADRIANAAAALRLYGAPVIIVDFGTATTFDVIVKDRRYIGGVIAPGVVTGAEHLIRRAARLSAFELKPPEHVVGRSTEESLQSGVYYGAVGQVDAIVRRIAAEERIRPMVIATGGLPQNTAIRQGGELSCSAADGPWSVAMCLAAQESVESGRPVAISAST